MTRLYPSAVCLLLTVVCLAGAACLHRPATTTSRTLEPQLLEPQLPDPARPTNKVPNAVPLRLLYTESRGFIGHRLLHQRPDGELTEDSVWRWSSPPSRYLDTALQLEANANSNVRLVESGTASVLAPMLLEWEIDSEQGTRLIGAVEYQVTGTDHLVHTEVVRASEPISEALPGNVASAAGRLLRHLASEGLKCVGTGR